MADELEEDEIDKAWPERHEFYGSVGQAISHWSSMETTIVQIAAILLKTTPEKTGLIFYSIMNFYTWLSVTEELFALEKEFEAHRNRWGLISDRLRGLNDIRVRLAHHTSFEKDYFNAPTLTPGKLDTRKKWKNHTPLTNKEIVGFTHKVLRIHKDLIELYLEMFRLTVASRKTLAEPKADPPSQDGSR